MPSTDVLPPVSATPAPPWGWRDVAIPLLIVLAFFLVAKGGLGYPAAPFFDEQYYANAALEILDGKVPREHAHPPLAKLGAALGMAVGQAPAPVPGVPWAPLMHGARLISVFLGLLGLIWVYLLGRLMGGSRLVGGLAAGLLALDGLYFVFSRAAMTNIYAVSFVMLGVLATWLALSRSQPAWLLLSGLGYGLAVSSRWTSLVALVLAMAAIAVHMLWREPAGRRGRWVLWTVGCLMALPALTYVATYAQNVLASAGGDVRALFSAPAWRYVIERQFGMFAWHTGELVSHQGASPWWSWPLVQRPVWLYFGLPANPAEVEGIFGVGNVFIWWASLPAMAYGVWRALVRRDFAMGFLAVHALAFWLVWILAGSRFTFMHYMFESIPFVTLILACVIAPAFKSVGEAVPSRWGNLPVVVASGYLVLVGWWAWYFNPLLTAKPISIEAYTARLWGGVENWEMVAQLNQFRRKYGLEDPAKYKAFVQKNMPTGEAYQRRLEQDDAKFRLQKP